MSQQTVPLQSDAESDVVALVSAELAVEAATAHRDIAERGLSIAAARYPEAMSTLNGEFEDIAVSLADHLIERVQR